MSAVSTFQQELDKGFSPNVEEQTLQRDRRQTVVAHEELGFEYDPNMNMDPGVNAEIPASSGGMEASNELFQKKQVKLPETNLNMRLKPLLSTEQITQVHTSIRELLVWKIKQFCDKTYALT